MSESLREDIVDGVFPPGVRLVERDLCERYDVSRTVVREVLRQLETDGLVIIVPNKGPEVARLTRSDVAAIYEVRTVLESLAGSLFTQRAGDAAIKQLGAAVSEVERAVAQGRMTDIIAAKDRFYDVMLEGAGNPIVTGTLRTLHARIQMMRALSMATAGRGDQTLHELREILDKVTARDAVGAGEACGRHVQAAAAIVLAELDQSAE